MITTTNPPTYAYPTNWKLALMLSTKDIITLNEIIAIKHPYSNEKTIAFAAANGVDVRDSFKSSTH